MALNNATADVLAQAIVTALGLTGAQATDALVKWKDVVRQIYSALKVDPVVTSTVVVASVTGVTSGGAVSGPGAGTATGALT